MWDSRWVEDEKSTAIPYAGKPFSSKQRIYWRVRIKDDQGTALPWSEPTWFDSGLLEDGDWQGAEWIACTRKIQTEYGPSDTMGPWIAAREDDEPAKKISYKIKFSLPDKYVVYAGAWWNHMSKGEIELMVNGRKGLNGTEGPPTIYYKDYSFYMQRENEVSINLTGVDLSTPVSFGMKIVFADGSKQIIQTSADWVVHLGEIKQPVKVVCGYGKPPLGKAKISPRAPLEVAWYKKDFDVPKEVSAARLYVCGLGYNEPYLNGEKVGDHVLDPGQTDYENVALYSVFDVRDQIKQGTNSLSILLGDGWYNNDRWFSHSRYLYGKPGLRAYLDIRYEDGTHDKLVTGGDWRWKGSGVTMSNLFLGDYIDYRKWHSEWEKPGTQTGWKQVRKVKALSPKLIAQDFPPIRVVREIDPVKTWQIGEKTWVVDVGQNISGWLALDFNEPEGTTMRIRATEMLLEDGKHLDNVPGSFWSCHSSPQHHQIIADGKSHSWRPYFSYHGFRFAEIHGLSKAPTPGQIKCLVVHSDTPVTATFKSSDPLLDRIFKMGIQTHLNNMHSVLEDCPHREKCQWGGDLHTSWATGFHTLDSASFYRQQVRLFYTPPFDPKGIPGRIGVGKRHTNKTLDFTWSVSPLFLAWHNYQVNGDFQSAGDHYDVMRKFLQYFEKNSPDLLPQIHRYGDHAAPEGIPRSPAESQLIAAFNFYAAADRFADFAELLGKADDGQWSHDLAERIRKSIIQKYYDPQKKTFGNGVHDSLALAFGVVDPSEREDVATSLAKIYQENGKKFDGGFMSYNIYPQLTENGYVDLALDMLRNPNYPGIAQSIRDYDATTIFEKFRNDSRGKQLRHSLDHHAMNHPTAWMLNYLAGIRCHPDEPGFRRILLQPYIPTNLEWMEADVKTAYGVIRSAWKQEGEHVNWSFTIPPNSVAEVSLPEAIENLDLDGEKVASNNNIELSAGHYIMSWTNKRSK
uniref:alpha-L-rhamnosidase n=1 Tax=Bythopirellula polymerisocia TaxID=2528003 RepID=UPI0018D48A22|nr:alpha-L-rhamnosidase [Bythopirellula polymerisocia]